MSDPKPSASSSNSTDVVIAGAGPVGLFLACELRLAGVSALVLERAEDPHSPLKQQPLGMRGLSVPTSESFDRRGLLDELAALATDRGAAPAGAHWAHQQRRPGGHFAGIQFFLDKVDAISWPDRLSSPAGTGMTMTDMMRVETILATRADTLGVEIRRGCGVESFEASDEGVTIRAGGETFSAGWLVGCDGGRSTVRKAGGFEFVGTDPEFTGYSLQVELADPARLPQGRHYTATGMYTFAPPGTIGLVEFDGGACHRVQPTREHAQAVLRRVTGVDVEVTSLKLAATWTDRAHQATAYRRGRVLLAGDAAHIHSPLGGQGLNLGLGDAMNLGWKLAATLRGDAPAGLLDTYFAERQPVGARVLDWSRAQVGLMRPSRSSRALAAIIHDLIETRDGATYFAERTWGMSLRYDLGGGHPLVGRSAPDFALTDGSRLGDLLRDGKGLILDFAEERPLEPLASLWDGRIAYVASDATARLGLGAVLVRPDGIVAWACDGALDPEAVAQAASRWFGAPVSDLHIM